jgi:hypothetical protein
MTYTTLKIEHSEDLDLLIQLAQRLGIELTEQKEVAISPVSALPLSAHLDKVLEEDKEVLTLLAQ